MIVLPVLGAVSQVFFAGSSRDASGYLSKMTAVGASCLASLCGLLLIFQMQTHTADMQGVESYAWLGSYAIGYEVGVDGLNALLVLLVSIVFPLLMVSEWAHSRGERGAYGLFLLLQSAVIGIVCSQDLFLIFFFWALSTLPFYFLLSMWGGEQREKAAFRYMITSSVGNALFFAAMVLVYYSVEPHTFSLGELLGGRVEGRYLQLGDGEVDVALLAFLLMAVGLSLRVPLWPVHGWFTFLTTQATSSVLVALTGVFVPVALYVFARLSYSLFPAETAMYGDLIMIFGAVNVVFGAIGAVAQKELRLVLAYICLASVGLLLMGVGSVDSAGLVGAVYQGLSVGLGMAGFGLFAGLIRRRTEESAFENADGDAVFGGIATTAPILALLTGIMVASLLGFPGLGGFVGHSLIMMGGYAVHPAAIAVIGGGILLLTFGLFSVYRSVFLGPAGKTSSRVDDLSVRERGYMLPLVALLLFLGVYPKPLLDLVRPSVLTLLSIVK